MFGRKKLLAEITRLSYRVAELEERICPCESHDWKKINYEFCMGAGADESVTVYTYKCKKCGKVVKTWKAL